MLTTDLSALLDWDSAALPVGHLPALLIRDLPAVGLGHVPAVVDGDGLTVLAPARALLSGEHVPSVGRQAGLRVLCRSVCCSMQYGEIYLSFGP